MIRDKLNLFIRDCKELGVFEISMDITGKYLAYSDYIEGKGIKVKRG